MTEKQEARLKELIHAMRELQDDVYNQTWMGFTEKQLDTLDRKFGEHITAIKKSMIKPEKRISDGFNS